MTSQQLESPGPVRSGNEASSVSSGFRNGSDSRTPSSLHTPQKATPGSTDSNLQSRGILPAYDVPETVDVLIIGAGPAGLTLACELQRRGVSYLLVDHSKPEYPNNVSKIAAKALPTQSIVIQHSTLEALATLGVGDSIISAGKQIRGASVISGGDLIASFRFVEEIGRSTFPFGLILEQWKLERILHHHLKRLGGRCLRNYVVWKLEVLSPESEHLSEPCVSTINYDVTAWMRLLDPVTKRPVVSSATLSPPARFSPQEVQEESSAAFKVSARVVVGCDGVSSIVRRAFQLPYEIQGPVCDYLCADISVSKWGFGPLNELNEMHGAPPNVKQPPMPGQPDEAGVPSPPTIMQSCYKERASSDWQRIRNSALMFENHILVLTDPTVEASVVMFPYKGSQLWRLVCQRVPDTSQGAKVARNAVSEDSTTAHGLDESEDSETIHHQTNNNHNRAATPPDNTAHTSETLTHKASTVSSFTSDPPIVKLDAPSDEEIQEIIGALLPGTVVAKVGWKIAYSAAYRLTPQMSRDCGYLAGDAARLHPPLWGEGLNEAIQDAFNLGWKLAAHLKCNRRKTLLSTYNTDRLTYTSRMMIHSMNCRDLIFVSKHLKKLNSCGFPLWDNLKYTMSTDSSTLSPLSFESIAITPHFISYTPTLASKASARPCSWGASQSVAYCAGDRLPSAVSVLNVVVGSGEQPRGVPFISYCESSILTLFLFLRVLPEGTKFKTIFGCQRNEAPPRYHKAAVRHLARLAVRLQGIVGRAEKSELAASSSSQTWRHIPQTFRHHLTVVWVACGLTDVNNPVTSANKLSDKSLPLELSNELRQYSTYLESTFISLDHTNDAVSQFGIELVDPSSNSFSQVLTKAFSKSSPAVSEHSNQGAGEQRGSSQDHITTIVPQEIASAGTPRSLSVSTLAKSFPKVGTSNGGNSSTGGSPPVVAVTTGGESPLQLRSSQGRSCDVKSSPPASAAPVHHHPSSPREKKPSSSSYEQQAPPTQLGGGENQSIRSSTSPRSGGSMSTRRPLPPITEKSAAFLLARPDKYICSIGYLDGHFESEVIAYIKSLYGIEKTPGVSTTTTVSASVVPF